MNSQQPPRGNRVLRLEPVERLALRLKDGVERRPFWALCGISLLYLAWTAVLASRKLMWNDELYTYYIAMLPNVADIWRAVMTGAEQIPPTFHLLTRGVLKLVGIGPISIRMPEILGFLAMMLCLFRFVARRTSAFYGLLAMLFPLVTDAYRYAFEARPYGLVLGLSGVALICWQAASEGPPRRLSLAFLSLSLAAALASHYYAVLSFVGLGVGEIVRTWSRRRLDPPIWIAFGVAGVVPILLFSPLILQSASYADTFWNRLSVNQLPFFYLGILGPARKAVGATVLVGMVYAMFVHAPPDRETRRTLPLHELAVALAFAALPAVGFVIGILVTNAFVNRYALQAVLGLSMLVAFAVYALPRGRALIGAALLLFMMGSFVLAQYGNLRTTLEESSFRLSAITLLQAKADMELPIVASEPHIFMSLAHYAPPAITGRLAYLGDPQASLRHLGHNSVDRGMMDLVGPWFRLPVKEYEPYIASHPRFWLYGNLGWLTWITDELQADSMRIELRGRLGGEYLLLVTRPAGGASSSGPGRP